MIAATNQLGHVVQRFDGLVVGWTAITEPAAARAQAQQQLDDLVRTPGAEYRIYPAIAEHA